jgi:deazaflavin-dependent oxidoreductase (nitroreductase family)|tara:strand:+ start:533 stop:955 length:423 start_codon:yes stop_codon:yes gene_type:complete
VSKYIPSPSKWVSDQVELYESSGGIEGTTMNGLPVIIVTNRGWKTDSIRKTPLMKVMDGKKYILVASNGGAPNHPSWYKNIKKEPKVQIQDGPTIYDMKANEVTDTITKNRLWEIMEKAFPPYRDYKNKTKRDIPVFLAE